MKGSPLMQVRKTQKGAALKRWFKEDWRTPSGKKATKVEKIHLGLQKKYQARLLPRGVN